jgi:Bacterial Ig-like domain (group 3)
LAIGSHTISAVYNGDATFVPSYFTAQHQLIPILYPTSITFTASPNPVLASQTISFKAIVTSAGQLPYGKVSFVDGTTALGAVALDTNSIAVFDTALLSSGKHIVKASYIGNANFGPASSSPVNVIVNTNQTTTQVTVNPAKVAAGATVLLSGTVASSAGTPTGSVVFYDGSVLLQNTAIDAHGVAVYGTTFSNAGVHGISAVYGANAGFASSRSSSVNVTVTASASGNATDTSLVAVPNSQVSRSFTLTARVTGSSGSPDGSVIFLDGTSRLGAVALDETGNATYQSSSLAAGVHYLSAFYPGRKTLSPSVSPVVTEKFATDTPDFSMALSPIDVVLSGASGSVQVNIDSVNGFDGDIALSCTSGSPLL